MKISAKEKTMIPVFKNILYTTDMSENSNYAFSYAASLANRYDALITIMHVLKNPMPTSENLVTNVLGEKKWQESLDGNKARVVEKIRARLEAFCEETQAELSSCPFLMKEVIVKIGNPVEAILEQINGHNYDLVIMGAHGHGGFTGAFMGSVSRRVLRRSATPVLVVRLAEEKNEKAGQLK
jgi:nucleotide-binding universal stress UspA family protein